MIKKMEKVEWDKKTGEQTDRCNASCNAIVRTRQMGQIRGVKREIQVMVVRENSTNIIK